MSKKLGRLSRVASSNSRKISSVDRGAKILTRAPLWYEGGNLHSTRLSGYMSATRANKMATLADIIDTFSKELETTIVYNSPNQLKSYVDDVYEALQVVVKEKETHHVSLIDAVFIYMKNAGVVISESVSLSQELERIEKISDSIQKDPFLIATAKEHVDKIDRLRKELASAISDYQTFLSKDSSL